MVFVYDSGPGHFTNEWSLDDADAVEQFVTYGLFMTACL